MSLSCRVYIVLILSLSLSSFASGGIKNKSWWKNTVIYQIFPRSYLDTDGDGSGDLNGKLLLFKKINIKCVKVKFLKKGITEKLNYLKDLGIGAIWLSPVYPSPWFDSGYDVSDYKDIDPKYGTLADFDKLVERAKEVDIKVGLET